MDLYYKLYLHTPSAIPFSSKIVPQKPLTTHQFTLGVSLESFYGIIKEVFFGSLRRACILCEEGNTASFITRVEYSNLGKSIVKGDFNGDGMEDLIIGAPGYRVDQFAQAGAIFYLQGPFNYTIGQTVEIETVAQLITSPNLEVFAKFGTSLTVVDLNKDGIDDLAISAPYSGSSNDLPDGMVYVLFGRQQLGFRRDGHFDLMINGSISRNPNAGEEDEDGEIIVDDRLNVLGERLFGVDLDGDGFKDLLIGSPHATPIVYGLQRGSLLAFLSSSLFTGNRSYLDASWILHGNQEFELFGSAAIMSSSRTLLVGSPGYVNRNDSKAHTTGQVSAFILPSPGSLPRPTLDFTIEGEEKYGHFGSYLSASNHGYIAISSSSQDSPLSIPKLLNFDGLWTRGKGYQGGAVTFYNASDLSHISEIQGSAALGHFGDSIVSEVGREGRQLLISEPMANGEQGIVYLLSPPTPDSIMAAREPKAVQSIYSKCWKGAYHERLGKSIISMDLNNNGEDNLVMSMESDFSSVKNFNKWSGGLRSGKVVILG